VASIKKLTIPIADFGLRNSEFKTFEKKDFPGETSRVLKEKEEKQYGEYRTRRLVLKYVSEGGIRAIDVI